MRQVLVTGLGGAGRTTVAAATALVAAESAAVNPDAPVTRVLFLSTDPAPVLGVPVAPAPGLRTTELSDGFHAVEITEGLWAARIDSAARFRTEFLALQERASTALDLLGATRLADEELTELPGSEQAALLRALAAAALGDWDTVVVDMPPVRETIALLALPEQLRRYLRRLLPPERQAARALRPLLASFAGVPMPAHWLYETTARLDAELAAVQQVIESPDTVLRLVAEPGLTAADALRTARTGLALHDLRIDQVIANRVLPRHSADPWLAGLAAQQEKTLHEWYDEWGPHSPVSEVAHAGRDPRGLDALRDIGAELHRHTARGPAGTTAADTYLAAGTPGDDLPSKRVIDQRSEDGTFVWVLSLPGAVKGDVHLVRRGEELVLTVGPFRRIVPLPSLLRRCTVSGAALTDGALRVRFTPDPDLWPRTR
ncbi:ArsA family ATPase [Streptomyces albipurpureus]|uniref:ArsA family ATPase n=1 Tax=Streptomyces albipurpureus TaxID=2897419 RepID=A0ABT0UVI0_9ACTN|nr:ArsA-related P-loop ATPase [Streptomyces sp. CWNU-1]MCM2392460.1 ArsA family ATPase [Streptomyces sp. CWNU-1]